MATPKPLGVLPTPGPGPAAPTPTSELVDAVRHWVHFDNLAESLGKQVQNARQLRADYETKVLKHLETTGMKNAVLQINGATLQRASKSKPVDLSWTYLEEQLQAYYKAKGRADESPVLLDFLQRHRSMKTQEFLKKTITAAATGAVPPVKPTLSSH